MPPPNAKPLMAAITGLADSSMRRITRLSARRGLPAAVRGLPGQLVDIGSGNEGLVPRPGNDHALYRLIRLQFLENRIELAYGLGVQRVELLGTIDSNDENPRAVLCQQVLETHTRSRVIIETLARFAAQQTRHDHSTQKGRWREALLSELVIHDVGDVKRRVQPPRNP